MPTLCPTPIDGRHRCRVRAIEPETSAVTSYYLEAASLEAASGRPLPAYTAGQYVMVWPPPCGASTARPCAYSLSTRDRGDGIYRITVRHRPDDGRENGAPAPAPVPADADCSGCAARMQRLTVGDIVDISAPTGGFSLPLTTGMVVLVGAGVGVTPLQAMLDAFVHSDDPRQLVFVQSTRNRRSHLFRAEVGWLAHDPRVRVHTVYTSPNESDVRGVDYHASERLTAGALLDIVGTRDVEFLICGPAGFMRELTTGLSARGVAATAIHTESFEAPLPRPVPLSLPLPLQLPGPAGPAAPRETRTDGHPVRFLRSGLTVAWDDQYQSLLELAEASGLAPDYFCRIGNCRTCECRGDGPVEYTVRLRTPVPSPRIVICCARPLGPVSLDL